MKMKFTAPAVRSLALPPGKREAIVFDGALAGFGVRLRDSGSRTYVVQYNVGRVTRRIPLGSVEAVDFGKARTAAKDILARVRLGQDPAQEKVEARAKVAETFGALLPRYLAHKKPSVRPRSFKETERHLMKKARSLHARGVATIDQRTAAILVAELADTDGPAAGRAARASLTAYFGWLQREGLTPNNPFLLTNKPAENGPRDRVLNDVELAAIWRATGDDQFGAIIKLLMLTGQRRTEIGDLCWSEIDFDRAVITLPTGRSKNRRVHEIPLSPAALAILAAQPRRLLPDGSLRNLIFGMADGGFRGWDTAKQQLDARIAAGSTEVEKWVLHDLRRSTATGMAELGVAPHVIEAVLNHVSGSKAGVAGIYNRSSYEREKRIALDRWGEHVLNVIEGRADNILPLRA